MLFKRPDSILCSCFRIFSRAMNRGVVIGTMALCLAAVSQMGGQTTGRTLPPSGYSNPSTVMMAMPSVAPLFLEGGGFSSTLHLVNDTLRPFEAQVDLYSLDGVRVATNMLTIPPFGLKLVRIHDLLQATNPALDIGSIRVSSTPSGDGLLAALALTHYGTTETYFDEELAMPTMEGSNTPRSPR